MHTLFKQPLPRQFSRLLSFVYSKKNNYNYSVSTKNGPSKYNKLVCLVYLVFCLCPFVCLCLLCTLCVSFSLFDATFVVNKRIYIMVQYSKYMANMIEIFTTEFSTYLYIVCNNSWKFNVRTVFYCMSKTQVSVTTRTTRLQNFS